MFQNLVSLSLTTATACVTLATGTCPSTMMTGMTGMTGGSTSTTSSDIIALEQLSLERLNRARLLPGAEAAVNGIAIDEGIPGQLNITAKQPLAMNAALTTAARGHSDDMLSRGFFAHDTPEGTTFTTRISNAGYMAMLAAENLAQASDTTSTQAQLVEQEHTNLFVDAGIAGRGHRVNMLNDADREVGIGVAVGQTSSGAVTTTNVLQTQDFGTQASSPIFVLGTVYNDTNGNGQYDHGEGVANATVTLGTQNATTNAGGGYVFEATGAGIFTISFTGGSSQTVTVSANGPNTKVDLRDGVTIVVNLGLGPLP